MRDPGAIMDEKLKFTAHIQQIINKGIKKRFLIFQQQKTHEKQMT